MPKAKKQLTNQEALKQIMNFSKFGALAEIFVIDAVHKMAEAVAASDPKQSDSPIMNGEAWVGVAKEIAEKMRAHLNIPAPVTPAPTVKEYRITRPNLYAFGSIGFTDKSARQGHYYHATSVEEARAIAAVDFPGEILDVEEAEA